MAVMDLFVSIGKGGSRLGISSAGTSLIFWFAPPSTKTLGTTQVTKVFLHESSALQPPMRVGFCHLPY
jgi:hypothetical protein